jgi:hypothetical protein
MKKEKPFTYRNINISGEVYNDIVLFGGGGSQPPPRHARDPVEEPEGVDTEMFPRPRDPTLQGKPPGAVSLTVIETVDLLSEGPIDGMASGSYEFVGIKGEVGYEEANFTPFVPTVKDGNIPHASGYLRSIYYNDMEIISKDGRYNFRNVDFAGTRGEAVGKNLLLGSFMNISSDPRAQVTRNIKERLRGPEVQYKE